MMFFSLSFCCLSCSLLSTAEAEYVAAWSCCSQILWIKQQLLDYDLKLGCVPIKCDNTSAINLTKNPVLHSRTKHIEIQHHFLRDHVEKKDVTFESLILKIILPTFLQNRYCDTLNPKIINTIIN